MLSFCMLPLAGVWLLAPVALCVCLAGSADQCKCVCMLSVCTENQSQCNDPRAFCVSVVFVKWVTAFPSLNHVQCRRKREGERTSYTSPRERRHSSYSTTVSTVMCYHLHSHLQNS